MSDAAMLSAGHVAGLLGISRRHVYALAHRGDLPSYRFGDAIRFDPSDVEAYKSACRTVVPQPPSVRLSIRTVNVANANDELRAYFKRMGIKTRDPAPRRFRGKRGQKVRLTPTSPSPQPTRQESVS